MEKKEIIKIFLERGTQLDKKSLDFFSTDENRVQEFLDKAKGLELPPILSLDFVRKVLAERKVEINIIKTLQKRREEVSVSDISSVLNKRYEKISSLLGRRLELVNLISINKIGPRTRKFSIIGMVREKDEYEKSLTLEDKTGEIKVFLEDELLLSKIVEDEVVGAICSKKEGSFFVEKIIFPDIPLKKEIAKSKEEVKCLFISDLHLEKEFKREYLENLYSFLERNKIDLIFVLGGISPRAKDVKDFFSSLPKAQKIFIKGENDANPDIDALKLEEFAFLEAKNVNFLLLHGKLVEKYLKIFDNPVNTLLELLRKRHLNPTFDVRLCSSDEAFLIDPVPDIIACGHFHMPGLVNYKGTTIISTGSFLTQPIYWIINLKNREILKLDLREKL